MASTEIAVTDTHALIWWIGNEKRLLGRRARKFFERVDAGSAVLCIPSIVLVEISEAVMGDDLHLDESFFTFVDRLCTTPSRYQVSDLSAEIVVRSTELFGIPERGDRLIAATAAVLGYPLITRDPKISAVIGEDHLWD
jgi:PIN domain nuclease of toxin-antitoxin system